MLVNRVSMFSGSDDIAAEGPVAAFLYAENLNIYASSIHPVLAIGFHRIILAMHFAWTCAAAPFVLPDPEIAWYSAPVAIVATAVAGAVSMLIWNPYVHQIHLRLPARARRSKEDLLAFARNVHPRTPLTVTRMRFAPWLSRQTILFGELRRLPTGLNPFFNLEHVPLHGGKTARQPSARSWLATQCLWRYYTARGGRDRSVAPGIWDLMWEQIPVKHG